MRILTAMAALAASGGVAGCVVAPPMAPLVAIPGPTKTPAQFQADDMACRVASVPLPAAATDRPATATAASTAATAQAAQQQLPPGAVYLQCMASKGNGVQPLAGTVPYQYGYYASYPIWARYADPYPYPWFYGDYISFGFYGGRWVGWHGGYYGGYGRGGYYGGGFRGGPGGGSGGGFRGGGGPAGGGAVGPRR